MPGLNILYSEKKLPAQTVSDSYDELKYKEDYYIKEFLSEPNFVMSFSGYETYPKQIYDNNDTIFLIEGLIYNASDKEIETSLRSIAEDYSNGFNYKNKVANFINRFDGEYLVFLYFKKTKNSLIFNDRWARLPTFYTINNNNFVLSREIKFILHWLQSIEFNRSWMAEFLIFEYNLGDKCLIKDIRSMKPALLMHLHRYDGRIQVDSEILHPDGFEGKNHYLTKKQNAARCAEMFQISLKSRVRKIIEKGYNIIADLSGGHDSRAVFAGLVNLDIDFLACNDHLIEGDEAELAGQAAELYGKSLINFDAQYPDKTFSGLSKITYLTDCLVNCSVSFDGFYDELDRKNIIRGKHVHFMGLGGEFLRHRYRPMKHYKSVVDMIRDEHFTNQIQIDETCSLLKLNKVEFLDNIQNEISGFPETDIEGKIKHLNFERYNKFDNSGENRHRIFNWVVAPFWGKDLFEFVMRNMPLEYFDYNFFTEFLKELDPKTLKVPIYAGIMGINPLKAMSLFNIKVMLKKTLRTRPFLYKLSKAIVSSWQGYHQDIEQKAFAEEILRRYDQSDAVKYYFDLDTLSGFLKRSPTILQFYQLLTLIVYMVEIERKFPDKFISV